MSDLRYDYLYEDEHVYKCICRKGFAWEYGPCDYCLGEYPCPDGCGENQCDCICDTEEE